MANFGILGNGCTCKVCGSDLISNRKIGCGCQKFYDNATMMVLKNHKEDGWYKYWSIKNDVYMKYLIAEDAEKIKRTTEKVRAMKKYAKCTEEEIQKIVDTKIHKSSFIPSIIAQYKEKGFVTYKQIQPIENHFAWDEDLNETICNEIKFLQNKFISEFQSKYDNEIIPLAHKLWGSK